MSFVHRYKISVNNLPTEKNLHDFLEAKLNAGMKSSTVLPYYYHLKLVCKELYKVNLDKCPLLATIVDRIKASDEYTFSDNDDNWMEEAADSGTPTSESSVGKFNFG